MTSRSLLAVGAPPVVLASASRTRAQLLRAAGVPFEQRPAAIDETSLKESMHAEGVTSGEAAVALAELKAIARKNWVLKSFIGQGYHIGAVEALRAAWVSELRRREL